jgi:two-component system, OmpR family, response regulator VicR
MGKKARILYVEDDPTLSLITKENLELRGYMVDFCEDGIKALEMTGSETYDLCILDVMLPRMDGFTLAGRIREMNSEIPILFLTARTAKEDRIHGLQLGADDYITKPFSIEELVLKVEIFLKRSRIVSKNDVMKPVMQIGRLTFDSSNQQLTDGKKSHQLTYRESELLKLFAQNINQVVKREEILVKIWGNDQFFSSRSLDVFVSRLRKLLRSDPSVRIENIHNVGYRLSILN